MTRKLRRRHKTYPSTVCLQRGDDIFHCPLYEDAAHKAETLAVGFCFQRLIKRREYEPGTRLMSTMGEKRHAYSRVFLSFLLKFSNLVGKRLQLTLESRVVLLDL